MRLPYFFTCIHFFIVLYYAALKGTTAMMNFPICRFILCEHTLVDELNRANACGFHSIIDKALNDIFNSNEDEPISLYNDGTPMLLMAMGKPISKDCYIIDHHHLMELVAMTSTHHDDYLALSEAVPHFEKKENRSLAEEDIANYNKAYETFQQLLGEFGKKNSEGVANNATTVNKYDILMFVEQHPEPTQEDLI